MSQTGSYSGGQSRRQHSPSYSSWTAQVRLQRASLNSHLFLYVVPSEPHTGSNFVLHSTVLQPSWISSSDRASLFSITYTAIGFPFRRPSYLHLSTLQFAQTLLRSQRTPSRQLRADRPFRFSAPGIHVQQNGKGYDELCLVNHKLYPLPKGRVQIQDNISLPKGLCRMQSVQARKVAPLTYAGVML